MSNVAIQTKNLSKQYAGGTHLALDRLNLSVESGEVYGFLGPNGAGKSTTIRLLLNFIQPSSGNGEILGRDMVSESTKIRKHVGYLAGELALYPKMKSSEFLNYMADLQPPKSRALRSELIKRFQFQAGLKMPIRDLSKGNRQKLGLIQAFMHEPEILILDEPTSGLDPLMQEEFFKLLHETKARGGTVFVSSHNLAEVQKMSDRVGFIRNGKLIHEQTIAELSDATGRTFDINFDGPVPLAELKKIAKSKVNVVNDHVASIHMRGDLAPMFAVLAKQRVVSLSQREANLEEEFLSYYREAK